MRYHGKRPHLVALHTHHFRERFAFSVYFSLTSLVLVNLRHEAIVFIHTRLLRLNTITWKSKKNQLCVMLLNFIAGKDVGVFLFYFSHSNVFLVNFRYEAKGVLLENWEIQLFCLISH